MNHIDESYNELCATILREGVRKPNRTGVDTIATTGLSLRHDMSQGFPLLTTKKIATKTMKVELEGFIQGVTSKSWYQSRGCKIWDEWCNPKKVPYGTDDETKKKMKAENDLGDIYGAQWRNFNGEGYDQLKNIVDTLKHNPTDRRMVCSAWNPLQLNSMALPPCHFAWQVVVVDNRLDLIWNQRSADAFLGIPFNLASYALLLHLLAKGAGLEEGILTGHFGDVHMYVNSLEAFAEQQSRDPFPLPVVVTEDFPSIFEWNHTMTTFPGYQHHSAIKVEVAV